MQVQLQSLDHVSEISSMETHHVFGNACRSLPVERHTVRETSQERQAERSIQIHSHTVVQSNVQIVHVQMKGKDQGSEVQNSTVQYTK